MNTALPEPVKRVNTLAEERFKLAVQQQRIELQYKKQEATLKAKLTEELTPIHTRITEIDNELYDTVTRNEKQLTQKGRRSFTTTAAMFQLMQKSSTIQVQDAKGVMDIARKLGVVRQIATAVRKYTLDRRKFNSWLKKNPEYLESFIDCLEPPAKDSLTIRPNGAHVVVYDGERISPPSIKIEPTAGEGE